MEGTFGNGSRHGALNYNAPHGVLHGVLHSNSNNRNGGTFSMHA